MKVHVRKNLGKKKLNYLKVTFHPSSSLLLKAFNHLTPASHSLPHKSNRQCESLQKNKSPDQGTSVLDTVYSHPAPKKSNNFSYNYLRCNLKKNLMPCSLEMFNHKNNTYTVTYKQASSAYFQFEEKFSFSELPSPFWKILFQIKNSVFAAYI